MATKLSKSQRNVLSKLKPDAWTFVGDRSIKALFELMRGGLIDSQMRLRSQDFEKGTARFSAAYKLTAAGLAAISE